MVKHERLAKLIFFVRSAQREAHSPRAVTPHHERKAERASQGWPDRMDVVECSRPTVVFTFAGESCGIPAGDACELVFLPALLRVAGQPSILSGFMNLRGAAVPVVRLERLFGRPAGPEDGYTTLVLVGSGGSALALAVDRVDDVLLLGPGDLRPVGKGQSFNDCATAEFDFNGRRATLLDASRILLEKERQCIEELRARAQAEMETPGASCR